uniref:SH3 domain-containing protein n=1 Tax=Bracon brevicornis TaxID=1563983 RepID=A0A6V7KU52_9HYME
MIDLSQFLCREKALAATGHRGAQLASDWLLAHVRDPALDREEPREYILYLCPTGHLAEKLAKFWVDSRELEWNKAHNYLPHITLTKFFEVPDELAELVSNSLDNLIDPEKCPKSIEFETYVSPNFMGLFVNDKPAKWLDTLGMKFVEKMATIGVTVEAHTSSLHISLAYQFSSNLFQPLRAMVEDLGPNSSSSFELRLYSRDPRLRELNVHKVTHSHSPRESDELELRPGDFIYLLEDACSSSIDGWVEGTSWLTGTSGYLPLNYTERTAQTDAWTLHNTVQIPNGNCEEVEIPRFRKPPVLSSSESVDTPDGVVIDSKPKEGSLPPTTLFRRIFICRHGERVDFTFGTWIPYCFEANGSYIRRDLNMPRSIPARNIQDFQNDSPLTTLGELQATLVGEAMKSASVRIDVAFTSPSLRCVQTLSKILEGLGSSIPMKVEPGFIEWLAWYPNGLPTWMGSEELVKAGFNIDRNYEPIVKIDDLPARENAAQYYERSHELIKSVVGSRVGNILIVAHAASLAACTRQLTGGRIPSAAEVTRLVQRVPYLACLTAQEEVDGWQLHPPPFPPITHSSNSRFDWKILI